MCVTGRAGDYGATEEYRIVTLGRPVKFTGTVQRSEAAQSGHHYVFVRPPRTAYRPCSGCYPVSGAVTFISAGHLNPSRLSRSLELPIGPNEE